MTENKQLTVLAVAEFNDVRLIDGGDTAVISFRAPNDREVAVLVPREAVAVLQARLTDVLAQPFSRNRHER